MAGKLGILIKTTIAVSVAVGLVSLAPPLTSSSSGGLRTGALGGPQMTDQQASSASYCEANLSGVDCACFVNAAEQVLNHKTEHAIGWRYADPWELAKGQASEACS